MVTDIVPLDLILIAPRPGEFASDSLWLDSLAGEKAIHENTRSRISLFVRLGVISWIVLVRARKHWNRLKVRGLRSPRAFVAVPNLFLRTLLPAFDPAARGKL